MAAGSRIVVEIAGSSASLQAAVEKAAVSLKGLGDVLARQMGVAQKTGDQTIRLNDLVGKSFQGVATQAGIASDRTIAAFERQGAVVLDSSKMQMRAVEQTAAASQASATAQVRASGESAAAAESAAVRQQRAAKRTEAAFGASSSGLTRMGRTVVQGLAAAAAGSIDLAVKFQRATTLLETQAGASAAQVDKLRKGMLAMAQQVGFTPNQLAAGMYHVVSSMNAVLPRAQRVSAELKILKIAAEGAQVGHTNLADTTYALASAMNALHVPASQAEKIMGTLNATVGAGDMTMQDLIEAMKSGLVPTARSAGLSLQSVGTALAVLGDLGMRGALAGTRLRMSIALLSSPSEASAKILQTLGMSAKEATSSSAAMAAALEKAGLRTTSMSADLRKPDGIFVALKDLRDHLIASGLTATGAAAVMSKAFGGGKMGATIVTLMQNQDRVKVKFQQIGATANQFGADWQKTQMTTGMQLKQLEGGLLSLGTSIGTHLLPVANQVVHGIRDFVTWLEKGTPAAHALEEAVAGIATIAIGSYLVSKLKTVVSLAREFGQLITDPLGSLGRFGAATRPGGPAGGLANQMTGQGGMIGGIRSPGMLPGSRTNPIVVVVEAGDVAGLGGQSASGLSTTEARAAQAERQAAQSVAGGVAPAAVGTGAASAEAAAAGGIMASLKTGLGALLKGGMIAGIGVTGAQLAGGAIGGSAGRAVSSVGTGAGIGAGAGAALGSIVPGVGTAVGAGIGGIFGGAIAAFLHFLNKSYGQQIADKLTQGFGGAYADNLKKGISTALDDAHKLIQQAQPTTLHAGRVGVTSIQPGIALTEAQKVKLAQDYVNAGTMVAKALEAGWNQYKFQSEPIMFTQLRAEIRAFPPQAQAFAIQSAIAFASGLAKQGRLPADAVAQMLRQAEAAFPGWEQYLGLSATAGMKQFTKALDLSKAEHGLSAQLAKMRGDFPQVSQAMDSTAGDVNAKSQAVIAALQNIVQTGTGPMKKQAQADIAALRASATRDFTAMDALVVQKMSDMSGSIQHGSQNASKTAATDFAHLDTAITLAMQSGVISASKGGQLIAQALNSTLKAFGGKTIPAVAAVTAGSIVSASNNILGAVGLAGGGWVGSPGGRGRDMVPAMLGEGEAVLNHPQQQVVNQALASQGIGGLPAVFAATRGTRHYMAAGGFAGTPRGTSVGGGMTNVGGSQQGYIDPIPGFTLGRTDMGIDASAAPGTPILAMGDSRLAGVIQGWYNGQPLLDFQLLSGVDAGRYWYVAEQITPVTEQIGAMFKEGQVVARFASSGTGIEIGWAANASGETLAQATGQTGDASHGNAPAGIAFRNFLASLGHGAAVPGGPGGPVAIPQIGVPKVQGTGTVADIVRAALTKETAAANAYAGSHITGAFGGAIPQASGPVLAQIYQVLAARGLNEIGAAGIIGNALQESGWNPASVGSGGGGLWGFTSGLISLAALQTFAASHQRAWTDPAVQTTFLLQHLSGGDIAALNAQTSPAAAADWFMNNWEHPAVATENAARREAGARQAYAMGYAGGGFVGHRPGSGTFTNRPRHPRIPHIGRTPRGISTGLNTRDMRELSIVGGQLNSIEQLIATTTGRYQADQTLFGPIEASGPFVNPDGSLNAKGYARKIRDDQTLLGLDTRLLDYYREEVPVVSHALRHWLGRGSRVFKHEQQDTRRLDANKRKLAENKVREASIRQALTDLSKPGANTVQQIQDQIKAARLHYGPVVRAAQRAKAGYHGKDKNARRNLQDAVLGARAMEQAALSPLEEALLSAQVGQQQQAQRTKTERFGLHQQLSSLSKDDAVIGKQDVGLSQALTRLRAITSGAGGDGSQIGINQGIALLETIGAKLGMVRWTGGRFAGIDTTMPGEIVTVRADIQTLKNDIMQTKNAAGVAKQQDQAQMVALLQQQNLQLAEALALNQSQTRALASMLPELPQYAQGGPVLRDTLAKVHDGEWVVPRDGQLVMRDSGGAGKTTVELHQHYHGTAGDLMRFIDQRVTHPNNVLAISRQVGQRTSMLASAPGGNRGRF